MQNPVFPQSSFRQRLSRRVLLWLAVLTFAVVGADNRAGADEAVDAAKTELTDIIDKAGAKFGRQLARSYLTSDESYDKTRAEAILAILADKSDRWARITYAERQANGFFGYASNAAALDYLPEYSEEFPKLGEFLNKHQNYRAMVATHAAALDPVYEKAKAACKKPLVRLPERLTGVDDAASLVYYVDCALEVDIETDAAERLRMLAGYVTVACDYEVPHAKCAASGYRRLADGEGSPPADRDLALALTGLYELFADEIEDGERPETSQQLFEPSDRVAKQIKGSDERHEKGKTKSAVSRLKKYVDRHPELNTADLTAIDNAIGRYHLETENWSEAVTHLESALKSGAVRDKEYWALYKAAIDANYGAGNYDAVHEHVVFAMNRAPRREMLLPEYLYPETPEDKPVAASDVAPVQ